MKAKDVMTSNVIRVDENTPVTDIARTLLKWRISAVPVVDANDEVVGIVSEGDLMHRPEAGTGRPSWWLSALVDPEKRATEYVKSRGHRAKDVMTRPVVTIDEDASLSQIAQLLEEHRIKRVPVMRGSKLVGIVSRANLLHGLGASDAAPEPAGEQDGRIRATILNTLSNETGIHLEALNVTVANRVVHLWGAAVSETQKDAIRIAAQSTPGVAAVEDHLTVLPEMFRHWLD